MNIEEIINEKIVDLPTLLNDTDNVIEFNSSFSEEIKEDIGRSFWYLLKFK